MSDWLKVNFTIVNKKMKEKKRKVVSGLFLFPEKYQNFLFFILFHEPVQIFALTPSTIQTWATTLPGMSGFQFPWWAIWARLIVIIWPMKKAECFSTWSSPSSVTHLWHFHDSRFTNRPWDKHYDITGYFFDSHEGFIFLFLVFVLKICIHRFPGQQNTALCLSGWTGLLYVAAQKAK